MQPVIQIENRHDERQPQRESIRVLAELKDQIDTCIADEVRTFPIEIDLIRIGGGGGLSAAIRYTDSGGNCRGIGASSMRMVKPR